MTQRDHKLMSTPVSVSDGLRRADARTWSVLLIGAVIAIAVVVLINVFVDKPKVRWPSSPTGPAPASESQEPRTYDVAPPNSVPPSD